ncbi:MAG TPA: hypothetical protein VFK42_09135 [Acidimicrobiales bacterium]|nr:hypothetical protein [Acidimicrobiales bacterium]
MNPAAFAAWLLTALAGFVLFATWAGGGGITRSNGGAFSPVVVFAHLGLAAIGLFAWIVHLVSGSDGAAWVSVGALVPLVVLGLVMVAVWLDGRSSSDNVDPATRPPEQWFPSSIVVLHGVGAVLTVVLVVVAAVRA